MQRRSYLSEMEPEQEAEDTAVRESSLAIRTEAITISSTRETDDPRSVEGPINPVITDAVGKAGLDRPMAVLDLNIAKFMWNTSSPSRP